MNNKSQSLIEFKYQPIDLSQDVDYENRKVKGYLAKFDIIDSDQDVIRKGAFLKSIAERGPASTSNRQIKYLLQHDRQQPAGVFLSLEEDSKGLVYEGVIEKTVSGDATLERLRMGFYKEHSFGFNYVQGKCEWSKMPYESLQNPMGVSINVEGGMADYFECKELNLFEGSIVTFGANSETQVISVKSAVAILEESNALKSLYDYLISKAPNYDYELALRNNYKKEISLLQSVAANSTKEMTKPNNKQIDYKYLLNNI